MDVGFRLIERAIARGPIPGAAVAIGDRESERQACFGEMESNGPAVTPDTWFDMASLTKVLCTVPLVLEAIASGHVDPRAPLREVLPEIAWLQERPNLGDATVLQLATHTSGLPAWQPLYTLGLDRATLLAKLLHTPLAQPPGLIEYSDLGFILLGYLLERVLEKPLDGLARALFGRLGLDGALGFSVPKNAPPAWRSPRRKRRGAGRRRRPRRPVWHVTGRVRLRSIAAGLPIAFNNGRGISQPGARARGATKHGTARIRLVVDGSGLEWG